MQHTLKYEERICGGMRSPIEVLRILNKQAENPEYKFLRLYRNLYNPEFYLLAYRNIYANKGSMTPGINGDTLDGLSETRIQRIIDSLKDSSYQPSPARREYIEKKNSTKKRPLGISAADDKLVQEVIRLILESIYESTFSDNSHGFRPQRSCHTALKEISKTFSGVKWFIEGDIQACFDSFDHTILINILRKRIADEAFIGLICKFLKAGYMENWEYHHTYSGIAQGSGFSPILANVYLNELDKHIEILKAKFTANNSEKRNRNSEYTKIGHQIEDLRRRYKKDWEEVDSEERDRRAKEIRQLRSKLRTMPKTVPGDPEFKGLQYTRYADDFIIGIIGSKEDARNIVRDIAEFLKEELGLTLSLEKTLITYSHDKARFLGYDITTSWTDQGTKRGIHKGKKPNGIVQLLVPHEAWESKMRQYGVIRVIKDKITEKEHWRIMGRTDLYRCDDIVILMKYNAEIRGLYNYYSLARNASTLGNFASYMKYSMFKTFASKYRTTVNKIKDRYFYKGKFCVEYETKKGPKKMFIFDGPFECKMKPFQSKTPWIEQVEVMPAYKKYVRANSIVTRIKKRRCELCGEYTTEPEIHQVKKLKELKGETDWEKKMLEIRRKTLIVCPDCHKRIHADKLT